MLTYHLKKLLTITGLIYTGYIISFCVITRKFTLPYPDYLSSDTIAFTLLFATIIHVHYDFIFSKYANRKKWRQYLLFSFLLSIVFFITDYLIYDDTGSGMIQQFLIVYPATFVYALLIAQIRQRTIRAEMEKELAEARVKAMQAQIHPHFLFNTLNSIYSTSLQEEARKTSHLIEMFSDLLRYSIDDNDKKRDIIQEFDFITNYVNLHRTRLLADHVLEYDVSIDANNCKIYAMLLLPFIENAFKYGLATNKPSKVRIDLRVKARQLSLHVENDIQAATGKGSGIGLKNTRARLNLFYPGRFALKNEWHNNKYIVSLVIDLAND
ncbi:Histidine kinase [Chitinophaga sp. YR573]|nr:Histidine kinase [Chitinophaga sp. YR573]